MLMLHSPSVCKVFPSIFNFVYHFSRWLLVGMAVEGYLATRYPHRAIHLCTQTRAKGVILLLTVVLVCVNAHFFWSFEITEIMETSKTPHSVTCNFDRYDRDKSEAFEQVVWPIVDAMVGDFVPGSVVLLCCVGMALLTSRGLHKGSASHQKWRERYIMDPEAQDELKLVFLGVGIFYIVFTTPKLGFVLFRYVLEHRNTATGLEGALLTLSVLATMLLYVEYSCKIAVYAAVSPRFRAEVRHRFQGLCKRYENAKQQLGKACGGSTKKNSGWRGANQGGDPESPMLRPPSFTV
jgi:hypothetical protein